MQRPHPEQELDVSAEPEEGQVWPHWSISPSFPRAGVHPEVGPVHCAHHLSLAPRANFGN